MNDPIPWNSEDIFEIKKSSSPEPLGQFKPNYAHSILVWRGFKLIQMKDPNLFQGEIISKWQQ